jgi:hypothetical protein
LVYISLKFGNIAEKISKTPNPPDPPPSTIRDANMICDPVVFLLYFGCNTVVFRAQYMKQMQFDSSRPAYGRLTPGHPEGSCKEDLL